MKDIFISHSHVDREVANRLVDYLESQDISCFIAPRDITAGANYASRLMKAMDDSKAIVLLSSAAINDSEHVHNEVDVVVRKGKPILPVLLEDFEFDDDLQYYLGRKHQVIAYPEEIEAYFPKILSELEKYVDHVKREAPKAEPAPLAGTTTVFEYKPDRGIMINPEDHQRNVSFRTDTLINMMGGIYESVEAIANADAAHEIFFNSGYASGKNFAERINSEWDTGHSVSEIQKKLDKWCAFDSAVGWGKFSISMDFDEENDTASGTLTINEAFLVDKSKKRKVCGFIKGYCTGVLETLMESVDVELECVECPLQKRFNNNCCVFNVIVKG